MLKCLSTPVSINIFQGQLLHKQLDTILLNECAKFCGSRAIIGLVPPRHRAVVDPKISLVGISWVANFFLLIFRRFQIFSCGYFVGPVFFLVDIPWV